MCAARRQPVPPGLYRRAGTTQGRREFAYPIAARSARAAARVAALLPYPAIYHLGGLLGRIAARGARREIRHTRINLRLCYPDLEERERARLARTSMVESIRSIVELAALWAWSRDRVVGLVREVRGEQHLLEAIARGRGVVVAGPHLGSWEMLGLFYSSRYRVTSLYTAPFDPALDRFVTRGRERLGARLAPASIGGIRALRQALLRGEVVGIMPDQDPGPGAGVFVPFFGVLAATSTLIARLVQTTGASMVLAFAERLPSGAGFRLHLRPGSPGIHDPDLLAATASLNCDIEGLVRERPEQYVWSYKRFRIRPPGDPSPY